MRKRLVIYPKFQFTLIGLIVLSIFLTACLTGIFAYLSYSDLVAQGAQEQFQKGHAYYKFVKYQYKLLAGYLAIAASMAAVIGGIVSLFFSNKMAGPLYRLKTYLEDMKAGKELGRITFRKKDYIKDLEPLLNHAFNKENIQQAPEDLRDTGS